MLDTGRSLSETERRALLREASERSILYLAHVKARPVARSAAALERMATLREPCPKGLWQRPCDTPSLRSGRQLFDHHACPGA
jgi:hypothetical protein